MSSYLYGMRRHGKDRSCHDGSEGMSDSFGGFPDTKLADEYMKLQHDFFKWQQQLLQNQQVLHSRVAPLASSGAPTLHSVGVLRDIMSQSTSNLPSSSEVHKPIERTIPIRLEGNESGDTIDHMNYKPVQRLSQSVQDLNLQLKDAASQSNTAVPFSNVEWHTEAPAVNVGPWKERPTTSVGVRQDRDYVTSAPLSRSAQDLTTKDSGHSKIQPLLAPQAMSQLNEKRSYEPQDITVKKSPNIPKPPDESSKSAFWRELEAKRADLGLLQSDEESASQPSQKKYVNGYAQDHPYNVTAEPITYSGHAPVTEIPSQTSDFRPRPLIKDEETAVKIKPRAHSADDRNARYTSVITVANDKSTPGHPPPQDRMRSVVQLNASEPQQRLYRPPNITPIVRGFRQTPDDQSTSSFHSKIISNATKNAPHTQNVPWRNATNEQFTTAPINNITSVTSLSGQSSKPNGAPMSSRLVSAMQAPQARISPPKQFPSDVRAMPGRVNSSTLDNESNSSVNSDQNATTLRTSPPRINSTSGMAFANVKLHPTETRPSPPKEPFRNDHTSTYPICVPPPPPSSISMPPPPPPPPAAPVPPPPPPQADERRTASGKRIISSKTVPTLDPREELMLAIRQFGGANNLRKSNQ